MSSEDFLPNTANLNSIATLNEKKKKTGTFVLNRIYINLVSAKL